MIALQWQGTGVSHSSATALPRIALGLRVSARPEDERVHGLTLHTQVHIECAARRYSDRERERLRELFGERAQWPTTVRSLLWTRLTTHVGAFVAARELELELPCESELELIASKYFFGLDGGDVPLRLMFSGTVLYGTERVQVAPIDLNQELVIKLPVGMVRDAVERHHADRMLVGLRRDVFEDLYRYRREHGLASWELVVEHLLGHKQQRGGTR